jgi:hypothetical protein
LKIKLKGHYFDTTELIEAELQAKLNTLREYDFHESLKKMAEELGTVHTQRRGQQLG